MSYDDNFVRPHRRQPDRSSSANSPECEDASARPPTASMWCRTSSGLTRLNADAAGGVTYPANNFAAYPYAIAAGPVGSIWFGRYFSGTLITSPDDGEVGYLDAASGAVTAFNTGERTAPELADPGSRRQHVVHQHRRRRGHRPHQRQRHERRAHRRSAATRRTRSPSARTARSTPPTRPTTSSSGPPPTSSRSPTSIRARARCSRARAGGIGPLPKVKAGKKPITVKQGAVPLKVACPKDAGATCVGKAKLTTNAKKKPQAISKSAKFKIKAGKNKQLKLKLTGKGFKQLKKGKATKVRVALYLKGTKEPVVVKVVKVKR